MKQPYQTQTFIFEGDVAVMLPDEFGFGPDEDVTFELINGTVYLHRANSAQNDTANTSFNPQ